MPVPTALTIAHGNYARAMALKRGYSAMRPYVSAAYRWHKRARRYGPTAYTAARKIYRTYRKYKNRRHKAHRRSQPSAPRVNRTSEFITSQQELLAHAFLNIRPIEIASSTSEIGERQQIVSHVKGMRLCDSFYNTTDNNLFRTVEVHWALCQIKCPLENFVENNRAAQAAAIKDYISDAFFRDSRQTQTAPGSQARSSPFVDQPTDYPFRYLCLPLNTDRFNVITHKRFRLVTKSPESSANGRWFKKLDRYFKVSKRMPFFNERDIYGKYPFFVATWYTTIAEEDYSSTLGAFVAHNFRDQLIHT